jgi:glycosyltransferase involved in cell wall biosynthesis
VTAVHSYEDCSLRQFEEAKRRDKMCIYDMPIGYYPAWEEMERTLAKNYADWLPAGGLASHRFARPEQKRKEMALADIVLIPSTFVGKTIAQFTEKQYAFAPYGVDTAFWQPPPIFKRDGPIRFIYSGQLSIRKGIPYLLEAWRKADIKDAELHLIGPWLLAASRRRDLPANVKHVGPCSHTELLKHYQSADVFVFASFFEGFGLVLLEAMSCGLPVVASISSAAPDLVDANNGKVLPAGDIDAWAEALREVSGNRNELSRMKIAARDKASHCTWERYREAISRSIASYS